MSDVAPMFQEKAKRRVPRWIWVLLVVSLSINLLIAGIVAGNMLAMRSGYWSSSVIVQRTQRFMRTLPAERREEVRNILNANKSRMVPYGQEVRAMRMQIRSLLDKENYNEEALSAALDTLADKEAVARHAAKSTMLAILAKLHPNERMRFLQVFMPYLNDTQGQVEISTQNNGVVDDKKQ
jgi:uncharacterized membrane protein